MNNLKIERKSQKLTLLELAKTTNISPGDISRIENHKIYPYRGWRKRLSTALGVSEKILFPEEYNQKKGWE
jgi:transcriptional regulator with XRE-family HTH domain